MIRAVRIFRSSEMIFSVICPEIASFRVESLGLNPLRPCEPLARELITGLLPMHPIDKLTIFRAHTLYCSAEIKTRFQYPVTSRIVRGLIRLARPVLSEGVTAHYYDHRLTQHGFFHILRQHCNLRQCLGDGDQKSMRTTSEAPVYFGYT